MTNGRNTSVLSVRLPDELANNLRAEAGRRNLLLNDYLKSILASYWKLPKVVYQHVPPEAEHAPGFGDIEPPPDLEKNPGYWNSPKARASEKYPGTRRNAACPCGAKNPNGTPKKYKRCCGI